MFLNLDTTAVLLTPVMLALAARTGIAALPLAMTTVWLANTASLLLPISNLTNLLAMERLGMSVQEFAGAALVPAARLHHGHDGLPVGVLLAAGRRGADRYDPPAPEPVADPVPVPDGGRWCCLLFIAAILPELPIEVAALAAAVADDRRLRLA